MHEFGSIGNKKRSAVDRTRTGDRRINSPMLYQLSYHGKWMVMLPKKLTLTGTIAAHLGLH
jgi:hypothetical protein